MYAARFASKTHTHLPVALLSLSHPSLFHPPTLTTQVSPKTLEMYFTKAKPNWVIIPENVSEWWKPYSVREKEKKEAARAGGKGPQ